MTTLALMFGQDPRGLTRDSRAVGAEGMRIRSELETVKQHARSAASALHSLAYATLEEVLADCSRPNWDGYGARPISAETAIRARYFLDDLPSSLPAPDIVPETDGELAIEWSLGPRRVFSVSIGEQGPLHFAGLFGEEERHGVESFDRVVSAEIHGYLRKLFSRGAAASTRRRTP
jgi:hypothetical protein